MASIRERIAAEEESVERTLADLNNTLRRPRKTVIELAATATFLYNTYNGMENILKQALKAENITVPKSDTWHKNLLEAAVSSTLLSEDTADRMREYLAFRHFFIHGYGFNLNKEPLQHLAENMPKLWKQFITEIKEKTK